MSMVDVTASISAPATAANTAPFTVTGGGGGAVSNAGDATATNPAKWVMIAIVAGVAIVGLALIFQWGKK